MDITDDDVTKTLEDMRERAATFAPVEGRPLQNGDYVQTQDQGNPEDEGDPLEAESVMCHIGAEETMAPFNENLRAPTSATTKISTFPTPPTIPIPN